MTCPGTPHRGHFHDDEPCPIVDARGIVESRPLTTGDVLIERFFRAQYNGRCALDKDHAIQVGDDVGRAVQAGGSCTVGTVCTECVNEITS